MMESASQKARASALVHDSEWRKYREVHFAARSKQRIGEELSQAFMKKQLDLGRLTRLDKVDPKWVDKKKYVRAYRWLYNGTKYVVIYNTKDDIFVTIYRITAR